MTLRIGLIIPSSNRMVEQEMARFVPPGVTLHVARLRMTGPHHVPLAQLLPRIEEAAGTLADAKCGVVTFHCTATSMEEGPDGEERALAAVARSGARDASTTATAVRRALAALGTRRLVLVTPYSAATTAEEAAFLRAAGVDVVHSVACALAGSDAYCSTPPEFWRDRAIEAARPDADLYFISCTNIAALGIIEEIERRLERPVITSNQVVLWDSLARLGHRDRRGCPGRLFAASTPAPVPA